MFALNGWFVAFLCFPRPAQSSVTMTHVTTARQEKPINRTMRNFKPYVLWTQVVTFLGILLACLFDTAFHARASALGLDTAFITLAEAAALFMALLVLAVCLERYVRPLSRSGALMTGVCGYAVMALVMS